MCSLFEWFWTTDVHSHDHLLAGTIRGVPWAKWLAHILYYWVQLRPGPEREGVPHIHAISLGSAQTKFNLIRYKGGLRPSISFHFISVLYEHWNTITSRLIHYKPSSLEILWPSDMPYYGHLPIGSKISPLATCRCHNSAATRQFPPNQVYLNLLAPLTCNFMVACLSGQSRSSHGPKRRLLQLANVITLHPLGWFIINHVYWDCLGPQLCIVMVSCPLGPSGAAHGPKHTVQHLANTVAQQPLGRFTPN